jgi:hypothetical protein
VQHADAQDVPGMAVQVDPMKPTLKAPGIDRLKLQYIELLLRLAFKSKLRRYILEEQDKIPWEALVYVTGQINYGGRAVQADPIKLTLKARGTMRLKLRYVGPL